MNLDLIAAVALQLLDLRIGPASRMIGLGDVFKTQAARADNESAAVVMIANVELRFHLPRGGRFDHARGFSRYRSSGGICVDRLHNSDVAVDSATDPHPNRCALGNER